MRSVRSRPLWAPMIWASGIAQIVEHLRQIRLLRSVPDIYDRPNVPLCRSGALGSKISCSAECAATCLLQPVRNGVSVTIQTENCDGAGSNESAVLPNGVVTIVNV